MLRATPRFTRENIPCHLQPTVGAMNRANWQPERSAAPRLTAAEAIAMAAARHGVTPGDVTGPRRYRHLIAARIEACALLHAQGWSSSAIGEALGRDHTTVLSLLAKASAGSKITAEVSANLTDCRST